MQQSMCSAACTAAEAHSLSMHSMEYKAQHLACGQHPPTHLARLRRCKLKRQPQRQQSQRSMGNRQLAG